MEVIHTVAYAERRLQFLRDGDKYAVAWDAEEPYGWCLPDAMLRWTFLPTTSDTFREMDRFILGYFPAGLVALVALETA